jgi:hypothetical protein
MGLMGPIPKAAGTQPAMATITPRATLPLPEGVVALEVPLGLSRRSYEAFKAWIDVMVSLSEKGILEPWYVEIYLSNSTQAEAHYTLGSWHEVKGLIRVAKQAQPEVSFRVIAPPVAQERDLAELREMGVRTF